MGVRLFCNRALVWYLASIDYEMPELSSDDLVMGFGLCPWSPTVTLHVILNLGVEAAVMCLDSLKLLSCARNPLVVLRRTQIPYSAAIDLVAGLGISHHRCSAPPQSRAVHPPAEPTCGVITDRSQGGRRRLSFVIDLGFYSFAVYFINL
ncbi:hypothetical protein M9H77_19401 [Catharanthus roseus]|uniref:Uncharacterized protein n=1 Tax=Catharanthus roseus TaxID=4058 RepID=A0ACC0BAI7_CATRO|nr:hypothetical protein M9H77_19401 [Catharanthus roseus]